MAEIEVVLKLLEQFERLMHEIYEELGGVFATDTDAAALFSRLAFEERSHLGEVRYLRRLTRQNRGHFADVDVDLDALRREVAQLESVRSAAPKLSLHEALVLAMEFEKGVAEVHSRRAIAMANPELAGLLASLQAGDERHHKALLTLARGRGLKSV